MKKPFVTVLFFAVLTLSTVAQEKLTLQQAIQTALEKNIDIIRAKTTMESNQANVTAAYGALLPSVSASANLGRSATYYPETFFSPAGISANNSVGASVNVSVTLFDGLSNYSTVSRAKNLATSSDYDLQKRRQDIILNVQQAYLTVLRNRQLLNVSQDNLKQSQQQLARITESNKVGAVAKADVYRQQVQTANDELAVISAESNYANSKYSLLYLLSLDVTKEYDFDDAQVTAEADRIDSSYLSEISDYQKLVEEALAQRPDYQSAQLSADAAANSITIARAGHYPSLNLNGSYGASGTAFDNFTDTKTWRWGLSLSIPIFEGFRTSTQIQTSELNYDLAEQNKEQTKRKVQVDVRTALLNLETAKKRLDVSLKNVVSATEDRRIAEERYNLGSNTLLDLLVATANYTRALSDKVNASYDFVYAKQQFRIVVGRDKY